MIKVIKGVIIIGLAGVITIVPVFKITSAYSNFKQYWSVRNEVKNLNLSLDAIDSQLASSRKKLSELNADNIDTESPKSVYEAIQGLDGITEMTVNIVTISGGVIKVSDDSTYDPESSSENIDGLRFVIKVDDTNKFVEELSNLNLAWETFHVAPLEKTVVLVYNAGGAY